MNENSFAFPEVCLEKDYILATYFVQSPTSDIIKLALAIAEEQTTGTWVKVPGETEEIKLRHGGKVTGVYEIPDYEFEIPKDVEERRYVLQVAFPTSNFDPQIPMLLTSVIGNIANSGKLKLLDLAFPKAWATGFKGPKFGLEGIRELLKVKQRPFINNMIKPCTGWTPEQGADMAYAVAKGGGDIIKDDELIAADPSFCPLQKRVKKIIAAIDKAYQETGEYTLYTVNITDRVDRLQENARRAIDAGANALMINFYTVGFSAARMITEDPEINVPVLAHIDFSGAMFGSPYNGISSPLLMGKLARMAGADMVIITSPYGKFPVVRNKYIQQVNMARQNYFGINPMLPMLSGGVYHGLVNRTIKELGTDICLAAGGAIHGHPRGSLAGARSMRQAIDAAMQGIPLRDYAKDHPELAEVIEIWGVEDGAALFDLKS